MIPKIIHYCWFGKNPLPESAINCINSWREFLPDYKIKQWNEDNFDVNIIPYTADAYKAKKYAFVSDYARFFILYHEGGIYFDTDVEIIKPLDDIIKKGGFIGFEESPSFFVNGQINPGLGMGCEKNNKLIAQILELYKKKIFINDLSYLYKNNVCTYTTDIFYKNGLKRIKGIQENNGFTIYPPTFFSPIHFTTKRLHISKETRTIHRYMASWTIKHRKSFKAHFWYLIPEFLLIIQNRIRRINEWNLKLKK